MSALITETRAGRYGIRGISLGGVYTSIHVPELGVLLDAGMPIRQFAALDHIFLSHGHGDHAGAISALLGIRGLLHDKKPPHIYLPEQILEKLQEALAAMSHLQRYELGFVPHPMKPGDEAQLRNDLHVRAFKTHHPVPSLGYLFFDRVSKLRDEFRGLPGHEIGKRKKEGADLFHTEERLELAYATDTLIRVLDTAPEIRKARVLILECTFLDERKSLEASRAGCHIHLDEIIERVDDFENEQLVLMHFSQIYKPREVRSILKDRVPRRLHDRIVVFAPERGPWPG